MGDMVEDTPQDAGLQDGNSAEADLGILDGDESDPLQGAEAEDAQEPSAGQAAPVDKMTELEAKVAELTKRYENATQLIGRQGQELGELRQLRAQTEVPKPAPKSKEEALDDFVKDPVKAIQEEIARREFTKQQEQLAAQTIWNRNQERLAQAVPNLDSLVPTILEIAKADGVQNPTPQMWVETMRTNPEVAFLYAKRAQDRLAYAQASNKGGDVLRKAAAATKRGPTLASATGTSPKSASLRRSDIADLSDAQLAKLLSETK